MASNLFDIEGIGRPRLKCSYLENQKLFHIFLIHLRNVHQICQILIKNIIVIATLLRNLQAVKDLVKLLSKKHCFTTTFDSQHVKGCQTLVKSISEHFHHIFSSL